MRSRSCGGQRCEKRGQFGFAADEQQSRAFAEPRKPRAADRRLCARSSVRRRGTPTRPSVRARRGAARNGRELAVVRECENAAARGSARGNRAPRTCRSPRCPRPDAAARPARSCSAPPRPRRSPQKIHGRPRSAVRISHWPVSDISVFITTTSNLRAARAAASSHGSARAPSGSQMPRQDAFVRRERLLRPRRIRRGGLEVENAQLHLRPRRERAEEIALIRRRNDGDERHASSLAASRAGRCGRAVLNGAGRAEELRRLRREMPDGQRPDQRAPRPWAAARW